MSHSGKNDPKDLGFEKLSVKDSDKEANKPDFRELNLGSPVSPLRTRPSGLTGSTTTATTTTTTTTSSSSSSSGSVSGQAKHAPLPKRHESSSHSGELSDTSPTARPTRHSKSSGQTRSPDSGSTRQHHQPSVNSPPATVNVLPTGNICPSGRILKSTGVGLTSNKSTRTDTLGSGSGLYGHGSIIRGGGGNAAGASQSSRGGSASAAGYPDNAQANRGRGGGGGGDAEEVKRLGNELYRKGCFAEALSMYDRAIALTPANSAYRANRAAALTGLGRVVEAVKECEEAIRLDPYYSRAHHRLGSLFLRSELLPIFGSWCCCV